MTQNIHKLPKADVHNHWHLGGHISRLNKRYPEANISIPKSYDGLTGMINFIYGDLNTVMLTAEDVIFFMENAIESSIDDNVTLLEASADIGLVRFFNNSVSELIEVVRLLKEKYKDQITIRPDIGVNKDLPVEKIYSDGISCIKSGVFNGIDIYGKEADKDLKPFQPFYDKAREHNLKTKLHIGEFSNHHSIEDAINLLQPDEIQHGIKAVDSKKTMDLILKHNIRLNVCPQSNIALGTVKNYKSHPIRQLFDHGINVTVNTDDLLLFNNTISDQYLKLIEDGVFNLEEIEQLRKNAFSS